MAQMAPEIAVALGLKSRARRRTNAGERLFTVTTAFDESANDGAGRFVPMIRLRGRWLQRLGFRKGDRIVVEERRGELVVKLARTR